MATKFCGTTTQLMNWCHAHGYQLPSISHGVHHMSFLSTLPLWSLIIGGIAGAYVGRVGVAAVWSTLKSDYASIRNMFSGSQTQVQSPASPATPAAAA